MPSGRFPATRMRRNRHDAWTRRLVAETRLSVDDLIWPVFVVEGNGLVTEVDSMPGVSRVSLDRLAAHVAPSVRLGIPAIALFPATPAGKKDAEGTESGNPDNLMCQAARLLKREFPDTGLVGDVALDPYTDHGHDGVIRDGYVANDESVAETKSLSDEVAGLSGCAGVKLRRWEAPCVERRGPGDEAGGSVWEGPLRGPDRGDQSAGGGASVWDRSSDGGEDAGVLGAARIPAEPAAGATEAGPVCRDHRRDPGRG
jgi:hypothetical protein